MKLLAILAGATVALGGNVALGAQVCECAPAWAGGDCTSCKYSFVGADVTTQCAPGSVALVEGSNYRSYQLAAARRETGDPILKKLTDAQLRCHNAGSYDLSMNKCVCSSDAIEGQYCEKCAGTKTNWPSCDVDACSAKPCKNGGSCDDEALLQEPCGLNTMQTNYQSCCTWDDPDNALVTNYRVMTHTNVDLQGVKTKTGNSCCGSLICSYGETCVDNKYCLPAGKEQCNQQIENEDDTITVITYNSCEPYETCCHGSCCSGTDTCQKEASTLKARLGFLKPGEVEDGVQYHDYETHQCFPNTYLSSPASIKIGLAPFVVMVTILGSLGLVLKTTGMGSKAISVPAVVNCLMSAFFLVFQRFWHVNFMLSFGSLIAIGSQAAESKWKHVASVAAQTIFFAALMGGFGLGGLFTSDYSVSMSSSSISNPDSWTEMASCSSHYGYFDYQGNKPWDVSSRYWGFCSHGWLSFILFAQEIVRALYFFQLVASAVTMVKGAEAFTPSPKTEKTLPASPAGDMVTPVVPQASSPAEP